MTKKIIKKCICKKILYIDMDNVLVNFQSGLEKIDPHLHKVVSRIYIRKGQRPLR